jgi:hypothetical protein
VIVAHLIIALQAHEHEHRHEYSHMHQMRKKFPFRDGTTPLFGLVDEEEH